jgi:hypothetical protein
LVLQLLAAWVQSFRQSFDFWIFRPPHFLGSGFQSSSSDPEIELI